MFQKLFRPASQRSALITDTARPGADLPVVPIWDDLVRRADEMAAVIDGHLEQSSDEQRHDAGIAALGPDRKALLMRDLWRLLH